MPDKEMPEVAVPEAWKEKTQKLKTKAPALEGADSAPAETLTKPGFGSGVHYVDGRDEKNPQELDAVVMVVFSERTAVNLRVLDPANAFGHFDAVQVEHDAGKAPGTWHYPQE
jgi:hypothetical protein